MAFVALMVLVASAVAEPEPRPSGIIAGAPILAAPAVGLGLGHGVILG